MSDMELRKCIGHAKRTRSDQRREQAEEQKHTAVAGRMSTDAPEQDAGPPGHSLVDLIGHNIDLKEELHMQPTVIKLLQAIATALSSSGYLVDTHTASCRLSSPCSQPDVTCLAAPGIPSWAVVVWTGEFKLGNTPPDISRAIGQQIRRTRNIFDGQGDQRQYAVTLILTLNSLELLWITRATLGSLLVRSTGQQPFSVSVQSPGFRWLVRLLLTQPDMLGYVEAAVPKLSHLGQVSVGNLQLIRRGTAAGTGSFVWRCQAAGGRAILKLNRDDQEASFP